ncbi:peptidylprolyl isomerase [Leucobacter viscericola]|uniref:Peptidylprolyl isomerase n=1 Tax=Leucobacter viscericola TaxID=2714935 RepID=A0A6G7XBT9_9MICO|nr:peptidylprolyl isomerase [Leucobacter viscericola]QIK61841.1 peptidylprolyl isomerase [Leucobacter viscericola]
MLRRIVPATAAAVLLLTGLTACSAQQDQSSDCVSQLKPGALSDGVKVKNGFGELPDVTIPKDVDIEVSQRSFAEKAKDRSEVAGEDTLVSINMALFDAKTSAPVYASPAFSGQAAGPEFLMVSKKQSNPVSEAVRCAAVGDRVVVGISAKDAAQISGDEGSALVGVIDVVAESPLRAQGKMRGLPNGFPAVVTNDEGRPGVVVPPVKAPEGTRSAVRIEGDGATVTDAENVVAQVTEVLWDPTVTDNAQKLLSDTWTDGIKALGNEAQISQSGNTFRTELTGKTVGSQVVIIENTGGKARVLVVDILGVS